MTISKAFFDPHEVLGPDEHRAMSLRLLDEAERDLEARDRRCASWRTWEAVVHELSAIAEQRGWNHEHKFSGIGCYLAKEYDRRELSDGIFLVEGEATNYFDIEKFTSQIRCEIAHARQLIADLEDLRQSPMRPYTIEDSDEQRTVHNLTGTTYPVGTTREHGFVNETRLRERSSMWDRSRPDEVVTGGISPLESKTTLQIDYDADQDILTLEGAAIETISPYDAEIAPRHAVRVYSECDGWATHVVLCGAAELLRDLLQAGENVSMTVETKEGPPATPAGCAGSTTRDGGDMAS